MARPGNCNIPSTTATTALSPTGPQNTTATRTLRPKSTYKKCLDAASEPRLGLAFGALRPKGNGGSSSAYGINVPCCFDPSFYFSKLLSQRRLLRLQSGF